MNRRSTLMMLWKLFPCAARCRVQGARLVEMWAKSRNERRLSSCSSENVTLDSGYGDPSLHGCSA
jgi:hypothetical protein